MTQPYVFAEPPDVAPRRYGLFGTARPWTGVDEHWMYGGLEYLSLAGYEAGFYPVGLDMAGGAGGTKTLPSSAGTTTARPFAVYAGIECGILGFSDAQVHARALRVLELSAQWAVENALWTGVGAGFPNLNNPTTPTPLGASALSLADALAGLEDWIGNNYNGRAVIHAARSVGIHASSKYYFIHDDPDTMDAKQTPVGSRWVFGAGYDGTGPAAVAPGAHQSWIYATGQVGILRSPALTPANLGEALDRSNNRVNLIAEQEYLLSLDAGVIGAALVDFTL